jgi:hypothetical protein
MELKIKILKDKENNLIVSFPYNPQFVEKIKTISMDKRHCRLSFQNWTKSDIVVYEQVLRHILQTKASPSMARILAGEALEIKASAGGTLKSVNYLN